MRPTKLLFILVALALVAPACRNAAGTIDSTEPGSGHGMMGIATGTAAGPGRATGATSAGQGSGLFACRSASGTAAGYDGYGPGRFRRGGLAPEQLEPNAITIDGHPANFHGTRRVTSGQPLEMEMDNDYFSPTVLKGRPGARLTIDLKNDGSRIHNFSIPSQHLDVNCGVRATGTVTVTFPPSGVLSFFCTYGRSSGMRGALSVG